MPWAQQPPWPSLPRMWGFVSPSTHRLQHGSWASFWPQVLLGLDQKCAAVEIWRTSPCCKKPRSALFPYLPASPVQKQAHFIRIANERRAECAAAPLLSSGRWAGRAGASSPTMAGRNWQHGTVKQLPWLPPKTKDSHPTPASPAWPKTSAQQGSAQPQTAAESPPFSPAHGVSLGSPSHSHELDPPTLLDQAASPGPPCVTREVEGTHTHICPSGA